MCGYNRMPCLLEGKKKNVGRAEFIPWNILVNHRIQAVRRPCENTWGLGSFPSDTRHFELTSSHKKECLMMTIAHVQLEAIVFEAFNTFGLFALLYQIISLL